jgi:hypothetical protein
MTLQEMIIELFEQLGDDTTLDPYDGAGVFDLTTAGATRCMNWINYGYEAVSSWRLRDGELVRFTSMFKNANVVLRDSGELEVMGEGDGYIDVEDFDYQLPMTFTRVVSDTGKRLRVLYAQEAAPNVRLFLDTKDHQIETGDKVTLHRMDYVFSDDNTTNNETDFGTISLPGAGRIVTPLRFIDTTNNRVIEPFDYSTTTFTPDLLQNDSDIMFFEPHTKGVMFNAPFVGDYGPMILEYYSLPTPLSAADARPEIPENFHIAIVLWATWFGLRRRQDYNSAYATKRDLEDVMLHATKQTDHSFDKVNRSLMIG